MTSDAKGEIAYDRLHRHFPQIRDEVNKSQVIFTEKRSAIIVMDKREGETRIYSIIAKDVKALKTGMRTVVREVDARNDKLTIDLVRYSLIDSDIALLIDYFKFEKCPFRRKVLVRQPQNLRDVAFEVLPAFESDDKITIVNREEDSNCYLVRNVYEENLAVYYSKTEAELFLSLNR